MAEIHVESIGRSIAFGDVYWDYRASSRGVNVSLRVRDAMLAWEAQVLDWGTPLEDAIALSKPTGVSPSDGREMAVKQAFRHFLQAALNSA